MSELHIISLGAGVQSTTMALMAAHGEITPMPDCAIFADTGAEPRAVYDHLEWLMSGNVLPFPVHVVSAGSLKQEILDAVAQKGRSDGRPPFHLANGDGSGGMLRRQCTGDFKIDPIHKQTREMIGLRPRQHGPKTVTVSQWIGISSDEIMRVKPAQAHWPIPPKSACTFCPYRSNVMWREMKRADPESWGEAVAIDRAIRGGMNNVKAEALFVHRSLTPLEDVDFSTVEDEGQLSMFNDECEGMCGV